jgi:hypothetical protein
MRRRLKGQAGMSLVEATIILLVLMMLTGVLAPSIFDYVHDAQLVLVKEDCEAIGVSIARLVRDVGPCLTKGFAPNNCLVATRVDILESLGSDPFLDPLTATIFGGPGAANIALHNWNDGIVGGVLGPNRDTFERQLVWNAPAYPVPGPWQWQFMMPKFGLGWRGAYLEGPIEPDPWGHKFLVNTGFLSVAYNDAGIPGTGQGEQWGGWNYDVFCISAGPNGVIQTPYADDVLIAAGVPRGGTRRGGDDITYTIQGDTR